MKPSSQSLTALYQGMYPADYSAPKTEELRHYRKNEDARCQLLLSLMVQMAQSIEALEMQQAQDALALAVALKKSTVAPAGAPQVEGATVEEDEEMMPVTQAVAGMPMPTPRPIAGPTTAAVIPAGTEVSLTPFTPYVPGGGA